LETYKPKKHTLKPKERLFGGFHFVHCPRPFLGGFLNIYLIDEMDGDEWISSIMDEKKVFIILVALGFKPM
jgi:hypothetical protein